MAYESYDDQAIEIDRLTCDLATTTDAASVHVRKAQHAITQLMSNAVYDIEFAEGSDGHDVTAELETAARALRHVQRIVAKRRADLLASDPAMNGTVR